MTIRVLLADDQAAIRMGLRLRLELEADIDVVGEAATGAAAIAMASVLHPDVVVMDVRMPELDGIAATHRIRASVPHSTVVMLSLHDDTDTRRRASLAGAASFIPKHRADALLIDAIRLAAATSARQGGQDP